ncbi:MAG TPA: hypothetical protein VMW58_11640 [Anaerolineae bacterium]|nr:hypothetical protein [Anaerolineae bacterium]
MDIADVEIGQELVYRSGQPWREWGPRIRVTSLDGPRVIGVVLDPMWNPWPVDSEFLGLATCFCLPGDGPKGE